MSEENGTKIADIFGQQFIKPIPMAVDIAEMGRQLWRDTPGLGKYQDAIHLASALRWSIETMHTYDNDDLLHLSDKFNCRNGNPLNICYPDSSTDGELFEHARQNPT